MKKKLGSLALILSILAGILSGCGNAPAASNKSVPESVQPSENETVTVSEAAPEVPEADSVQPELSAVEEPIYEKVPVEVPFAEGESVSMFLLIPPFISAQLSSTNELTVLGELEKRTGLTFDITPGNYLDGSTDVNLLIASGDYPDIINHADLYSGGIEAAMEHNIVLDLHDYIMNDMPNFLATMKSYDVDALKQMTTASGRIGYFPQVHAKPYIDSFAIGLNQDIMDQLNLEIPKTFDQLHDVLSKVYAETGLQYGLSNQGTDAALMMGFGAPAFGTTGAGIEGFRVVDGTVEYGATTDSARTYLETMAQWFSEGLIYSDFLSYEDFQQTNMVAAGTLFGNGNVNAQTLGEAAGNGVNITAIPYLTEKEGDPIQLKGSGEIVRSAAWSVSTGADEETVSLICQLVDYIFSEEGTLLFNYGVEGQGYELDENGSPSGATLL